MDINSQCATIYTDSLNETSKPIQEFLFNRLHVFNQNMKSLQIQMMKNLENSILKLAENQSENIHCVEQIRNLFHNKYLSLKDIQTQYKDRVIQLQQQTNSLHNKLHKDWVTFVICNNNNNMQKIKIEYDSEATEVTENENETENENILQHNMMEHELEQLSIEPNLNINTNNNDNKTEEQKNENETGNESHIEYEMYYECIHCDNKLESISFYENHNRLVHKDTTPWKCQQCNTQYAQRGGLIGHNNKVHLKKFKCRYCEKTFESDYNRTLHHRTHTGEKPFKCDYCNKSFRRPGTLTKHQKSIHERIKCKQCNKGFARNKDLRKHKRIHSSEKQYNCKKCGKKFAKRSKYKSHKNKCSVKL